MQGEGKTKEIVESRLGKKAVYRRAIKGEPRRREGTEKGGGRIYIEGVSREAGVIGDEGKVKDEQSRETG